MADAQENSAMTLKANIQLSFCFVQLPGDKILRIVTQPTFSSDYCYQRYSDLLMQGQHESHYLQEVGVRPQRQDYEHTCLKKLITLQQLQT